MHRLMVIALVLATACKQKPAEDMGATPGRSGAMGAAGDMGSAMGTTMPDGLAPPSDAPVAKTPDELAKRYDECTRFANERSPELAGCYAPGVAFGAPALAHHRREPQLVLIADDTVIAILLLSAPELGVLAGHVVEADPQGRFARDRVFAGPNPARPSANEFPTKLALISKGHDVERTNLAAFEKLAAAAAQRDRDAFGALLADDAVWSVQSRPKDLTKAEVVKTDVAIPRARVWAAGDHVAATDDTALAVVRFADGKVSEAWLFGAR